MATTKPAAKKAAKPAAAAKKPATKKAAPPSVEAQIAALGWDLYRAHPAETIVSPYHEKTGNDRRHIKVKPGNYAAHKRADTRLIDMHGETPEQLLQRIQDWEAREVPHA